MAFSRTTRLATVFAAAALALAVIPGRSVRAPIEDSKTPDKIPAPVKTMPPSFFPGSTKKHTVHLDSWIDSKSATKVNKALRDFDQADPGGTIELRIDSPGGDVGAGLAIIKTMKSLRGPVDTVCEKNCLSMAAVILAAGHYRSAEPGAKMMIHETSGDPPKMRYSEAVRWMKTWDELENEMITILAERTGHSKEELAKLLERDIYMTVEQARDFHLIDGPRP